MTVFDYHKSDLNPEAIAVRIDDRDDTVAVNFGDWTRLVLSYDQAKAVWAGLDEHFGLTGSGDIEEDRAKPQP